MSSSPPSPFHATSTVGDWFPVCLVVCAMLLVGCSSVKPIETTLQPTWSAETGPLETVHVSPDGERLLVASGKHALILDGHDGHPIGEREEALTVGKVLRSGTFVEGVQLSSMDAERYSFAFLDGTDRVLVFDYTMSTNTVEAVDLRTGDRMWKNNSYAWSLEKYQSAGTRLASNAATSFGLGAGAATAALTTDLLRHRYVEDLIVSLPEYDGFLFKTLDGLRFVEMETGRTTWTAPEVTGSGLELVQPVSGTDDLLVVTNFTSLLEAAAGSKQVLRLDLNTGEVKWSTGYGADRGDRLYDLQHRGDRVILTFTGGAAEVFDLETGEEVLQTRSAGQSTAEKYMGANLIATEETALPALSDDALYSVHTANFKLIGRPDKFVRKFDLTTGEEVWTSPPLEGAHDLLDIIYANGTVLARASGDRQVAAWNADTGEQLWRRTDLAPVAPPVLRDETLYVAGKEDVYAVDPHTGDTLHEAYHAAEDVGEPEHLNLHENHLVVLSRQGLASYATSDLKLEYTTPFQGHFAEMDTPEISYEIVGETLVVPIGMQPSLRGLHALTLSDGTLHGSVGRLDGEDSSSRPAGSLWNGYFVPENGRSVYVFRVPDTLVKYRIH